MILQDYILPYERISMRFTLKRYWLRWKLFIGIYDETKRFQIIYTAACALAMSGIISTMYAIYHLTH